MKKYAVWKKLINKIPDCSSCPPGWFFLKKNRDMRKLRRLTQPQFMQRYPSFIKIPAIVVFSIYWPFRAFHLSSLFTQRFGEIIQKETGISRIRQFISQLFLLLFFSIHPREYYAYSFYEKEKLRNFDLFFYGFETGRYIGQHHDANAEKIVNDKKAFETFCKEKNLPCVQSIDEFPNKNQLDVNRILKTALNSPVILKPFTSFRGEGIIIIEPMKNGEFLLNGIKTAAPNELSQILKKRLLPVDYLIQPMLKNHIQINDLTNGRLASVRVITMLDKPKGKVEYLAAVFQTPRGKQHTSNNGFLCPVDDKKGVLGTARRFRAISEKIERHIDTGALITGRKLPFWDEIKEICLNAHSALGEFVSLGWDVAITENGPLLLETNSWWDFYMVQAALNMPLGKTSLPKKILSTNPHINIDTFSFCN